MSFKTQSYCQRQGKAHRYRADRCLDCFQPMNELDKQLLALDKVEEDAKCYHCGEPWGYVGENCHRCGHVKGQKLGSIIQKTIEASVLTAAGVAAVLLLV